ncbi:hypothetical protein D3C87_1049010 [compost metagenome]
MSSSLIHGVSNSSRAICAVAITSCTLWQPAVLGSTGTASLRSSSQKPLPRSLLPEPWLAVWRRSEAVSIAGFARCTAASSTSGEG